LIDFLYSLRFFDYCVFDWHLLNNYFVVYSDIISNVKYHDENDASMIEYEHESLDEA